MKGKAAWKMKIWFETDSSNYILNILTARLGHDSSDKWSNLGQLRKKSNKIFYRNQFFHTHKIFNILEFFYIPKTILQKKFKTSSSRGFIFTLQNNYLYTQLAFAFHFLEIFYIIHYHIAPFLSLLQKAFCLFLLQKDFGTFHEPFLKAILCFFL